MSKMNEVAQAYFDFRRAYNDLHIVAGAVSDQSCLTLLALLKNEMYFLPGFLSHYRRLGVERFVFLNDRSDDGSFEFLCRQPDTVVVQSGRTYGDTVDLPSLLSDVIVDARISHHWRSMLHDMFVRDRWALHVDLDEFVQLPEGMRFQDVISSVEKEGVRVVRGVMLDVYPKNILELVEQKNAVRLDTSAAWYFDAEQHIRLRSNSRPKIVYGGARSRLYCHYGIDKLYPAYGVAREKSIKRFRRKLRFDGRPPPYGPLWKPTLMKWEDKNYFVSAHEVSLSASVCHLLPIQHYRFASNLYQKIQMAILESSYYKNSIDYRLMAELLRVMETRNGSFLYRKSRQIESFDDFVQTDNAFGLR